MPCLVALQSAGFPGNNARQNALTVRRRRAYSMCPRCVHEPSRHCRRLQSSAFAREPGVALCEAQRTVMENAFISPMHFCQLDGIDLMITSGFTRRRTSLVVGVEANYQTDPGSGKSPYLKSVHWPLISSKLVQGVWPKCFGANRRAPPHVGWVWLRKGPVAKSCRAGVVMVYSGECDPLAGRSPAGCFRQQGSTPACLESSASLHNCSV